MPGTFNPWSSTIDLFYLGMDSVTVWSYIFMRQGKYMWVFHNLLYHFGIIVVRTYLMETQNIYAWLVILYILFCSHLKVQWPVLHLARVRWGMNYGLYHMHWQLSNKWWCIQVRMLELSWGYSDINKLFSVL